MIAGRPGHDPHAGRHPPDAGAPAPRAAGTNGMEQFIRVSLRHIRRLAILLIGTTVVLIGVVMLVTPGPATIVVPIGLGILAIEFAWARRLLHEVRERAANMRDQYWGRKW